MSSQPLVSAADLHRGELEAWTARQLEPHLYYLEQASYAPREPKEFNDPTWGTIILHPVEIVILDSPLLQRLRRIRQLGVVHLVYPAALHTRFEHSLGTLHQVERITSAINTHGAIGGGSKPIDVRHRKLLRLAALCHDVGHGVMSHVSENALENFSESEDLQLAFSDLVGIEDVSLSEIAAFYIIGSDSFHQLFEIAKRLTHDHDWADDTVRLVQRAVIGEKIDDQVPLLHELISGPFDADKLDYMTRDAKMCGVPVVTDIPRLVQKVRAVELSQSQLPQEIGETVKEGLPSYVITGIALSGGRTLDELMLGQTLLYDKLYRHQKVRAAEAMVAAIFREVGAIVAGGPLMARVLIDDEELLGLDLEMVAALAGGTLEEGEAARAAVACDLAERLRSRRLFVRAFAFAQNMPLDPYRSDPEQWRGLEALTREGRDEEKRGQLIDEIAQEASSIIGAAQRTSVLELLGGQDLKPYIWLDPPEPPPQSSDTARAYLIAEDGRILRFRDDFAETTGWSNAYLLTRDTGYVFAPREIAPFVFLAAESVVRETFGVRLPRSMLSHVKLDHEELEALKRTLVEANYYKTSPRDLTPMPERLTRADVRNRAESIVASLAGYEGPVREGHAEKRASLNNPDRIIDWLRQFENDDLIDAGLRMLGRVRLVGRTELAAAVEEFTRRAPEFKGASLTPIGAAKDSGAVVAYYAGDIAPRHGMKVRELPAALGAGGPLLFVDDFVGRGSQAINIIEAWLGETPTEDLREERGQELGASLVEALRQSEIAFLFTAGKREGAERLQERAQTLGLNARVEVHLTDLPRAFGDGGYRDEDQEAQFRAKCTEIGMQLLVDDAVGHDKAWAQERALGYGNNGYLVVFPYNTPTQSLTCLWAKGSFGGIEWVPLFPRRPKR